MHVSNSALLLCCHINSACRKIDSESDVKFWKIKMSMLHYSSSFV